MNKLGDDYMHGPEMNGIRVSGHHKKHFGFWTGGVGQVSKGNGSYVLCRDENVLHNFDGAIMLVDKETTLDIQYKNKLTALNNSLSRQKITAEQYDLRMLKLEESLAANSYREEIKFSFSR